jgi:hypothetical protein
MDAALRGSDLSRQRCRIIAAFPDSGEDVQLDRLERRSFLVRIQRNSKCVPVSSGVFSCIELAI